MAGAWGIVNACAWEHFLPERKERLALDLHFQAYGQGEPLIILHGLFGSLENWHSASREYAAHFQVFALDQRNHGHSPHAPEMTYGLMAEDVARWMDGQRLASARVLGHSMGGKTAMQLALSHPERVSRLVVVDIAPQEQALRHDRILAGLLSLDLARYHRRQEMEAALEATVPELNVRRFLLKNAVPAEGGGFRWRLGLREIAANYAHLGAAVTGAAPFDKPALFVRGERSDYLSQADLPGIRAWFPQAELRTVAGAGHWVHVENPAEFNAMVLEFLQHPGKTR